MADYMSRWYIRERPPIWLLALLDVGQLFAVTTEQDCHHACQKNVLILVPVTGLSRCSITVRSQISVHFICILILFCHGVDMLSVALEYYVTVSACARSVDLHAFDRSFVIKFPSSVFLNVMYM